MSERLGPAAGVLALTLLALLLPPYWQYVATVSIGAMLVGASLVMLVGQARCITLATGAVMAIGAYGAALLTIRLGWPFPLALLGAGVLGGLAGLVMAVPSVRFRGHNLAMVTLVFQAVTIIILREQRGLTGGAEGLRVPAPELLGHAIRGDSGMLLLVGCGAALTLLPLAMLMAGAFGRNLRALSRNEVAARAFGIGIGAHLVAAFVVSSAAIAIASALIASRARIIDPDSFGVQASITALSYPIVGGMGTVWGGLLGGGMMRLLPEALRPIADYIELIIAVLVLLVLTLFPGGLLALVQRVLPARTAPAQPVDAARPATLGVKHAQGEAPAILAGDVAKAYGALRAVDGAQLNVPQGALFGLMGPNGAGKTTLFNALSGFTPPDAGSIQLLGQVVTQAPVERRIALGVARTFQHVAIFPGLTCRENVLVGLGRNGVWHALCHSVMEALGSDAARQEAAQADWALAEVGLAALAERPAETLSLGNQRRLEIARAIVSCPRLILLDEPVSGVSKSEVAQIGALLRRLNRELGVTMLVVEHNIGFLLDLCDEVAVMSGGRVIASGPPQEVVARADVRLAYFGEGTAA